MFFHLLKLTISLQECSRFIPHRNWFGAKVMCGEMNEFALIPTSTRWDNLTPPAYFIGDRAWARIMRQDLSKRRFRRERAKLRARRWKQRAEARNHEGMSCE